MEQLWRDRCSGVVPFRMTKRLLRKVDVEAATGEEQRTRAADELPARLWLFWTYLVRLGAQPSDKALTRLLAAWRRSGYVLLKSPEGFGVQALGTGDEYAIFRSVKEALAHLARVGGAVFLSRAGGGLGFSADPLGSTHASVFRKGEAFDEVAFGEYTLLIPELDDRDATALTAHDALGEATAAFEREISPVFGYSAAASDLKEFTRYLGCHTEVSALTTPSEVFWYQYFSGEYGGRVDMVAYRDSGFSIVARPCGGVVARLTDHPDEGLSRVASVRETWRYRLLPWRRAD